MKFSDLVDEVERLTGANAPPITREQLEEWLIRIWEPKRHLKLSPQGQQELARYAARLYREQNGKGAESAPNTTNYEY